MAEATVIVRADPMLFMGLCCSLLSEDVALEKKSNLNTTLTSFEINLPPPHPCLVIV